MIWIFNESKYSIMHIHVKHIHIYKLCLTYAVIGQLPCLYQAMQTRLRHGYIKHGYSGFANMFPSPRSWRFQGLGSWGLGSAKKRARRKSGGKFGEGGGVSPQTPRPQPQKPPTTQATCFPVLFYKRNRKWTPCVYIT